MSELFVFARLHARPYKDAALASAISEVVGASRQEPGCRFIRAFRGIRDPLLFYIHSCWSDEAAFEIHAELPHTRRFLDRVPPLIDHPFEDVTRTHLLATVA